MMNDSELKKVSLRQKDLFELAFYALRYVLPRHTYAASDVGDLITYYKVHITDKDKEILRKEIRKEITGGRMHNIDKEYWQQFLERF